MNLTTTSGNGAMSASKVREAIRRGELRLPTTGYADGYMQANLVILPESHAADFQLFCERNPKSCPLLGVGRPGDPGLPGLGSIDIRTDVPRYRVYRSGIHTETVDDLKELWRPDLVTFALGCSFSFESAILKVGIEIRHISAGRNVPMYATNLPVEPAGPFKGSMVVSMRSFKPHDLIQAIVLSERLPLAHGAPVHLGDPSEIGIADIQQPEFGDRPVIEAGDVCGFWACGVTPQLALQEAKLDFAITHEPGYMLVTDLLAGAAAAA
ncbi:MULTISPECIES: putative hydro-lyase [unclassified Aureimonas]|uniref:putative hydro-lyase n=2 Tax=unclassified Aureimonas TaxID=2615206 RepID=UPI0012E34F45|nr:MULTISPECIES: putative hydro-lyase [unclassified Aureimonas]